MKWFYLLILNVFFSACSNATQNRLYDLDEPVARFKLHKDLNEISGLHAISDSVLLAIQDEKGTLFFLNTKGEIIKKKSFGEDADYEGVTAYKKSFYALKSNGNLIQIKGGKKKVHPFKKKGSFDFEGLCVDTLKNRLLIACKSHPDKDKDDFIYIYGFDLRKKKFEDKPVFKIKKQDSFKVFNPSACALHPNGNLYVLSASAKMLISISSQGEIIEVYDLISQLFSQPEGIAFMSNGDMYISNEKNTAQPNIMKFTSL